MEFCVSKDHKPLGGSLTYQVSKMNTAHPQQARLEFQLSEGRVNRLGRSGQHIERILLDCQSQLCQKEICGKRCFSLCLLFNPLTLSHDGLCCGVIPSLGVDQSEQFKHKFGPNLWGATDEFWYSNESSGINAVEWLLQISSTINHQSRICVAGHLCSTNMT